MAGEIEPPTGARDQPSKRPNENARMCRGRCRDTLRLARNLNCARVSCAVRAWHGHTRAILLVTTVLRFKSFYGHIRSIFSPLSRVSVPVSQGSVWDPSIARPRPTSGHARLYLYVFQSYVVSTIEVPMYK